MLLEDDNLLDMADSWADWVESWSAENVSRVLTGGPGYLAAVLVMSFDHMVESYIRLEVGYPAP